MKATSALTTLALLPAALAASVPTHGRKMLWGDGICWSCSDHGARSWWVFQDCVCDAGYTGTCCDEPVTCSASSDLMCPASRLAAKEAQCAAASEGTALRIGTAEMGLPKSIQGLFWLTEQGDSSALMTFATSNDGAGLSTLNMDEEYQMSIRVGGDRTWSFNDQATSYELVEAIDLIYKFRFEDAAGARPTSAEEAVAAQIIPSAANLNDLSLTATSLLNFRAELAPEGSHTRYRDSVVWGRPSSVFGFEGGYYDLVQVVDGNGQRIEPAYSDFVRYCGNEDETGSSPGRMHYHEA